MMSEEFNLNPERLLIDVFEIAKVEVGNRK